MTTISEAAVKNRDLIPNGLVGSDSINSITDFTHSKLNPSYLTTDDKNDFANTFICHLIFYAVLCVSLILYIVIDLGFGSFVKNQFLQLIKNPKNNFVEKNPAFA